MTAAPPIGLYYEEFEVGRQMMTRARTITEADIVQFGSLTGDFNPMHFDAHYMQNHMLGQRVAHGMLTLSYAVAQAYQLGFMERTTLAFREMSVKFSQPVFIGDTVHVDIEVIELKDAARLGGGLVTMSFRIINQNDVAVQKGEWKVLVMSKPEGIAENTDA
jgi:acyl dehydratase